MSLPYRSVAATIGRCIAAATKRLGGKTSVSIRPSALVRCGLKHIRCHQRLDVRRSVLGASRRRTINTAAGRRLMLKTPAFLYGIKGYRNTIVRAFAITGQIGYQFPTRSFDVVQNAG